MARLMIAVRDPAAPNRPEVPWQHDRDRINQRHRPAEELVLGRGVFEC